MNLTSRTIHSSSSAHLFYELSFELKFDSFGSWAKSNELIIESSLELFSSWFGSFPALLGMNHSNNFIYVLSFFLSSHKFTQIKLFTTSTCIYDFTLGLRIFLNGLLCTHIRRHARTSYLTMWDSSLELDIKFRH